MPITDHVAQPVQAVAVALAGPRSGNQVSSSHKLPTPSTGQHLILRPRALTRSGGGVPLALGEPCGPRGSTRSPQRASHWRCSRGENKEQLPLTIGINPTIRKIASIAKNRWWKSPFIFHFSRALATLVHESLSVCRLNLYPVIFHVSGALVSAGLLGTESHGLFCGGEGCGPLCGRGCSGVSARSWGLP